MRSRYGSGTSSRCDCTPARPQVDAEVRRTGVRGDTGAAITDDKILDRVQEIGAILVTRGSVESSDFSSWRRELRRNARVRSFRVSVLRRSVDHREQPGPRRYR